MIERASDVNAAVTIDGDRRDHAIRCRIPGRIQAAVGIEPRKIASCDAIHIGKGSADNDLSVGLPRNGRDGAAPQDLRNRGTDDRLRGGDIDLYVETSLPAEDRLRRRFRLLALLLERLGEQKVDLVMADPGNPEEQTRLVVREAKTKGLRL